MQVWEGCVVRASVGGLCSVEVWEGCGVWNVGGLCRAQCGRVV